MSDPSSASHPKRCVLVTGSAGAVGRVVVGALQTAGHEVRGLDRQAHGALRHETLGDIAEAETWREAFAVVDGESTIDTLVHLAAYPLAKGRFLEDLLGPNVVGLYRALEVAAEHGLRRVILTSTVQTVGGWKGSGPTPVDVHAPTNFYAATKCFAEDLGAVFARKRLPSVIAARIGWFTRNREEVDLMRKDRHSQRMFVSPGDLGRFFVCAVGADHAGFGAYWCMGAGPPPESPADPPPSSPYDLEPGQRDLVFTPSDRFPEGLDPSWFEPEVSPIPAVVSAPNEEKS
ncbi:MAG: NAD(P)-dependent oxidoreductase [Planctomycetota bacterium]